jgi:hypothetical protein
MPEWMSYSLSDALMFSPRVYYRLIELYNEAVAPAQVLTIGLGIAMLAAFFRPGDSGFRFGAIALGASWLWVSYGFLWERFATINWPISYVVPFTVLQGVMLIGFGVSGAGLSLPARRSITTAAGLILFAAAVILYPFIAPLLDRPWAAAEIFGLMPDPTAIATLAFLAIAAGGVRWLLMIIPVLWCAISSVMLWTMGSADYVIPLAGALVAVAIGLTNPWRTERRAGVRAD